MAFSKKKRSKKTETAEEFVQPQKLSTTAPEKKTASVSLSSALSGQEKIALLAYTYWEQRGRPSGSPDEDWFRAEQEIHSRINVAE
jgi:hypothetical protein